MSIERPVFVLGVERSGANLLAWSIGQHPAFVIDLPTPWLGTFAADLDKVYESATAEDRGHFASRGVTGPQFHRVLGGAILNLMTASGDAGSPRRLVDATPEHLFNVFALRRLFPDALFVHVVRDVSSTVALLLDKDISKLFRSYHRETKAYGHWLSGMRAGLAAEQALGSGTVLRVLHRDLVNDPKETLRRCLDFVGEEWDDGCLRVLDGVSAVEGPRPSPEDGDGNGDPVPFQEEAAVLSQMLLNAPVPSYAPNPVLIEELDRAAFRSRHQATPSDVEGLVTQVRSVTEAVTPAQTRVLVVSRGDDRLLEVSGRTASHFPQDENGDYLGYHPADSADAISRLEAQRERGAQFLVVPSTAFWWLDHYREFRMHLEKRYPVVAHQEDVCVIYSLDPQARIGLDLRLPTAEPMTLPATEHLLTLRLRELEAELAALRADGAPEEGRTR
ncbi:MAG: sulfotransferase [Actinomycetota bacterium]|nr:sulfotransferase [Actinomycetota bacterium]